MSRTTFIEFDGTRILQMDFSMLQDTDEIVRHIGEAKAIVATQPKASLLVLLKVKGSTFNKAVATAISDLAQHDKPYVIASAIVGMEGLMSVVLKTVSRLTRRSFGLFDDDLTAKRWLLEQK